MVSQGWSGYDSTIANSAITQTTTSKNTYGATVYTVGIFEGANVNGTDNTNTFMRKLSSGTGYYLLQVTLLHLIISSRQFLITYSLAVHPLLL